MVNMAVQMLAVQEHLTKMIEGVIDQATNGSERSRQSSAGVLGVSDIGNCREYVRRVIVAEEPSHTPNSYNQAAFNGTAIGDKIENAMIESYPDDGWIKQGVVVVKMKAGGFELSLSGHPDLYNRTDLIDFKTMDGLGVIRRSGPSMQQRFQTVLYADALIKRGDMDKDCTLSLVYLDRSGSENTPVVWSRPYAEAEVEEARLWFEDVVYAVAHKEFTSRDPSREWCFACCPFAVACRGEDTDAEGLITDPLVIDAVKVYTEAHDTIKAAEKDKKSAASILIGLNGSVGTHTVRTIEIGESVIPETTRRGYRRLDLRPVRKRKP